jgi:hypothetical protein
MCLGVGHPAFAFGAPKSELWGRWIKHDPKSKITIDHQVWAEFLKKYLVVDEDGINRLAYDRVSSKSKDALERYLVALENTNVDTLARPEQRAYWINLYNALTIKVVLDHYPVETIQDIDISPGFFESGPWGKKLLKIRGERFSLNDIEHRILRPIWQDPRIHYAVNCASFGCPNLLPKPFEATRMNQQLDTAARDFINHDRAVWFDGDDLGASSIYKWFSEDFGGNDRNILEHLKKYAAPNLRARLNKKRDINVYHYDWSLNGATSN